MADEKDQEAMAAEWAAALEKEEAEASGEAPEENPNMASGLSAEAETDKKAADAAQDAGQDMPENMAQSMENTAEDASLASQEAAKVKSEELAAEWAAALADTEQEDLKKEKKQKESSGKARDASFVDFTDEAKAPSDEANRKDLDFILDIPLDISAELGRTRLLVNELLQLGQGSVVELNKLAGEPLEVYVNGKIIARGEAVVINEKFGIRLTDIISPIERVKQLG